MVHLLHKLLMLFNFIFIIFPYTAVSNSSKTIKILLIHNNDIHSMFAGVIEDGRPNYNIYDTAHSYGGFPRIATVLKREREKAKKENLTVFFVNNGDSFTGTDYFFLYGETILITMMNLLNFTVVGVGNLDLELGSRALNNYVSGVNFPVIITNIRDRRIKGTKRSHVERVNGHLIGFVAYLGTTTASVSRVDSLIFTDEISEIISEVGYLRALGVRTVIGLSNTAAVKDLELLNICNCLDILISGQEYPHRVSIRNKSVPYPYVHKTKTGNKIPVLSISTGSKYLGLMYITIDTESGKLTNYSGETLFLDKSVELDEQVLKQLQVYDQDIHELRVESVGQTKYSMELSNRICSVRECVVGNLLCDALVAHGTLLYQGLNEYWTDAPIAIMSTGSFTGTDINPGIITKSNIYESIPYRELYYLVSISGKYLLQALLHAVHRYSPNESLHYHEFLQHSGLKVVYSLAKRESRRISKAYARCSQCAIPSYEPILRQNYYNIIISSLLYDGVEGFHMFKRRGVKVKKYSASSFDIVINYLKNNNPVYPEIGRRIVLEGSATKNNLHIAFTFVIFYYKLSAIIQYF